MERDLGAHDAVGDWTTAVPDDMKPAPEGVSVEALLGRVGAGARQMVAAATEAIVKRFGDRGSCILVDDGARVVFSTELPHLTDLRIDLGRYPEIAAALVRREVVVVEDVRASVLLQPVAAQLPAHLGSVAVVPLVAGDRCLGVILVQSGQRRTMTPADLQAAGLEGRLAGTLLHLQFGAELASNLNRLTTLSQGQPAPAGAAALSVVPGGPSMSALSSLSASLPSSMASMSSVPGALPAARASRGRILVGEDDADQAAAVIAILVDEGFDADHAADGAEVLRSARRQQPDLILLDVNMPVLNGFDALAALVSDVRTRDVPILIVSGAADLLPRVRGLKLDTIDFLRKPFSLLELLARVDRSLSQAALRGHLRLEASIDDLTGLANPRYLRERLALEQSRIARYGTHSAIVMVDVDKLKEINDRHGHIVGSRILRAIGETLRNEIRETDLAARYGGDEFVVLLPHTTANEACAFADRVLAFLRRLRPDGVEVSLSMGVAALDPSDGQSIDRLLAQADAAAYRAKRAGGSRVCVFDKKVDSANLSREARPVTPRS